MFFKLSVSLLLNVNLELFWIRVGFHFINPIQSPHTPPPLAKKLNNFKAGQVMTTKLNDFS